MAYCCFGNPTRSWARDKDHHPLQQLQMNHYYLLVITHDQFHWLVVSPLKGLDFEPHRPSPLAALCCPLAHLGTSLPRVELEELGPSMSLSLDRTRHESLNDWRGIGLDLLVIAGVNAYRFISVPEFDDWRKPEWMHFQVNSASCALALCHASYWLRMAKNGTECQVIPSEATTLKTEKDPS